MLKHYLTTAFRNLVRNKIFTVINIMGLSIGMAVFILISLWIGYEKSFDTFHENGDRIYMLMTDMTTPNKPITIWSTTPAPLGPVIEDKIPEVEKVIRTSSLRSTKLIFEKEQFYESGIYADSMFFEYFTFPLRDGNPQLVLDQRDAVVISESLADKYFKGRNPVGETLEIKEWFFEEARTVIITGIFKDLPDNSSLRFVNVVMPFETFLFYTPYNMHWGNFNHMSYAVLRPNTNVSDVSVKLKNFIKENRPDKESTAELFLYPLKDIHLRNDFSKGRKASGAIVLIRLFTIVSYFVLIIACINYINLSTANITRRYKEVGIKKIIGARKGMLVRQFMMESFLLNFMAIIVACVIVYLLIPGFNDLFYKNISFSNTKNLYFLLSIILILSTIFSGIYPSILLSRINPVQILKGSRTSIKFFNMRDALVIFQFTLSIALIIGILVVFKQVNFIRNKNIGMNRENVIRFGIEEAMKHRESFKQTLENIPGVKSVGFSNQHPLYTSNSTSDPTWEGKPEDDETFFTLMQTDNGFINTLGIEILDGENFPDNVHPSIGHLLINQKAAEVMGMEDPIGQKLTFWNVDDGKIVGVVKDFHHQSMRREIKPLIIYHQTESGWLANVKLSGDNLPETLEQISQTFKEFENGRAIDYQFLDADFERMYRSEALMQKLSMGLTILSVLISCLGLFGLALYTVNRQTKSIAIRKVNGAKIDQIVVLLSKDFVKWIAISILIASPIAYFFMNQWLLNFAYRTNFDWWIFLVAGGLSLLIAIITVSFQTIKAALANPVDSLRYE
jgi:ABC-type antimicrobial peptide transport system permease subunit